MFDDIIIIDYNSTDKSIEICKTICPRCKIIKSRNEFFDAKKCDEEVMDIENGIEGIKMVLNTTEFLFCETSVKDIFDEEPISYSVSTISAYSLKNYTIKNNLELYKALLNDDVSYHIDRSDRQLHNFPNGNYEVGRHVTYNKSIPTKKAYIVWFGYFPMNDELLKRKLQIKDKIPDTDKQLGYGFHHLYDEDKMKNINIEKSNSGKKLEELEPDLYKLILKMSN
jgi:hypothetical protein